MKHGVLRCDVSFYDLPYECHLHPTDEFLLESLLPEHKEELLVAHRAPGRRPRNFDPAQGNNSSTSDGHQPLTHLSSLGFSMYMPK
jgi:hypothetical protein